MEVEKDLIKREIQKLTLLLNSLIEKISGLNSNSSKSGIEEVNETLKSQFDLSLDRISEIETSELINRIAEFHESHTEKIAELIYEVVMQIESTDFGQHCEKSKLAKKGIIIIDFLNEQSNTFSMKRMNIKNALQQRL
ncbi:hypothetical protein KFZ70_00560 [Tamlana fucoidanivorans]|uniref:Uncharacterized protein n=1 Tax=Allotamlana fucoidanivorans TaxID=2583814 RepID=A0A5C4SBJ7_9FLAO|nr:hypothetical protein [Tamlana fucoidanivorans]TNJ40919.1 hypothetical protein FGF67_16690 [Tamlana fucoidanivorans]